MPPLPIFLLFFIHFLISETAGYPGPPIPPMTTAKDFFERFMKAINDGNQTAIKEFFAPKFRAECEQTGFFTFLPQQIGGYSYTIEHAFSDIVEEPNAKIRCVNTTVHFRGPHPTYTRKHFNITLQNLNRNPQMYPLAWQIRSMTYKFYFTHKRNIQMQNPTPENIIGSVLQEFVDAVNYQDIPRLQRLIELDGGGEIVTPTGIQQLHDLLVFNQGGIRSFRVVNADHLTATITFTNMSTKITNLFWFVFKNHNPQGIWKITDMKLMYNDFGPPRDFFSGF